MQVAADIPEREEKRVTRRRRCLAVGAPVLAELLLFQKECAGKR